jgi:leucyl-tRNA synthetase
MLPRGYFCNGYVQVDGEKMSKSLGNFITMEDLLNQYGSDASRVALALCGDNLDDANFEHATANSAILHLSQMEVLFTELSNKKNKMRKDGEGDEKV